MKGRKVSETRLSTSRLTVPQDANPYGNVHGGVIMRLIDEAGAVAAIRHSRMNTVTASIDRLDLLKPVYVGELVHFKSNINFVGRTSMEVGVRVEAENLYTGDFRHVASAYLTFVSLDENQRPVPQPPLILETDEDRRRHAEAGERRRIRLAACGKSGANARGKACKEASAE